MANIINQKDCLNTRKNLGFGDCIIDFGQVDGFILTPKGWSLNLATSTFDKDYVLEQVQSGNFVPFLGAVEFMDNTPENTTEEYQGGVKSVVRKGLPEFSFKFIKGGWKFANAVASWDSMEAYDMLLVSKNGSIAGVNASSAVLSGFDLGMLSSGSFKQSDGATSSNIMVMLQLLNEKEYNQDVAILDRSALGFNASSEIYPISDAVLLDGTADASDNKIAVKVAFAMNSAEVVRALDIDNFKVYVNGVGATISVLTFNSLTMKYEISLATPPTAGNTVVVELWDDTLGVATAKVGQRFFKGKSANITVQA